MWNDPAKLERLGKAFGDMPGGMLPFGGAGAGKRGLEGHVPAEEDDDEDDDVESPFLKAAMDGDVEAVEKLIKEGGAGARAAHVDCCGDVEDSFVRVWA
jgi:hypothetical protein